MKNVFGSKKTRLGMKMDVKPSRSTMLMSKVGQLSCRVHHYSQTITGGRKGVTCFFYVYLILGLI